MVRFRRVIAVRFVNLMSEEVSDGIVNEKGDKVVKTEVYNKLLGVSAAVATIQRLELLNVFESSVR